MAWGAAEQVAAVMSGRSSDDLTLDGFKANQKYLDLRRAADAQDRVGVLDEKIAWLSEQLQRGVSD